MQLTEYIFYKFIICRNIYEFIVISKSNFSITRIYVILDDSPCRTGLTIDGSSPGTISSPGYSEGENYPYLSDCIWIITVETGNVKLKISEDFDMEDG